MGLGWLVSAHSRGRGDSSSILFTKMRLGPQGTKGVIYGYIGGRYPGWKVTVLQLNFGGRGSWRWPCDFNT